MNSNIVRNLKLGGVSGGLGTAAWILGGPVAGLLIGAGGLIIANQQIPADDRPWDDIEELINQGEHGKLEFKERFSSKKNEKISKGIIKTIAGFANTNGGELIIGITDDGETIGVEQEVQEAGNHDKLELIIHNCVRNSLGGDFGKNYRVTFEDFQNHTLCRIEVCKANKRVFAFNTGDFYKRHGNQTIPYSPKEIHELDKSEE